MKKYCQLVDCGDGGGLLRCVNPVDVPDTVSDPIAWLACMLPGYAGFRPADPSIQSGATALADADLTDPAQFTNPGTAVQPPSEADVEVLPSEQT